MRRRTILGLGVAGLLARWTGAASAAPVSSAPVPSAPVRSGLYRVNGWLLTEADLRRLPDAARRAVPVASTGTVVSRR